MSSHNTTTQIQTLASLSTRYNRTTQLIFNRLWL